MEPAWLFDSFAPLLGGLVGVLVGIYGWDLWLLRGGRECGIHDDA